MSKMFEFICQKGLTLRVINISKIDLLVIKYVLRVKII